MHLNIYLLWPTTMCIYIYIFIWPYPKDIYCKSILLIHNLPLWNPLEDYLICTQLKVKPTQSLSIFILINSIILTTDDGFILSVSGEQPERQFSL